MAQNAELYAAYQRIRDTQYESLHADQRKLIDNALRDFRLAGVALDPERKQRFRELMERLATAQARFDENVLDATNAWTRAVDDVAELAGLPDAVIARARAEATSHGREGWLFTLDAPNYQAVLTHAESRRLREDFYTAWVTRASEQGAPQWDNTALIDEILALRHEAAQLAGFGSFAEYSLATKMARDPAEVMDFLHRLARLCRPAAQKEFAELEAFAGSRLEAWDVAFHSERLKRERLAVSEEALRPYFPLPRVLHGLFEVAQRLYGVRIVERTDVEVYHPEVRFFDIVAGSDERRGGFFLDLYARAKKRGGAWMDECRGRIDLAGEHALPVAYLVCNFTPPGDSGRPSQLTHHEVLTLFHEFGHGLHHMLTRVDFPSVAGINGVPWDAVELPSQFMENFAWREEVLPLISSHVETGAALPLDELRKLQGTRSYQAGMQSVRQLEFALFDFRLHAEFTPERGSRSCRPWPRSATRSPSCGRPRSIGSRTASSTSSRAATRQAITATSGPRCCRPMRSAPSRNRASSTRRRRSGSSARSSSAAAAGTRWKPSSSSAAASPNSNRCCASSGSLRDGNVAYLPIILGSLLLNFVIGSELSRPRMLSRVAWSRKAILFSGIAANLAVLGYFKYTDFLIANLNLTAGLSITLPGILLPLAISFFTFQAGCLSDR
jgi:Zn-dependent oligopeptidase